MLLLWLVALMMLGLAMPLQPTVGYNDSLNSATCTRAAVASTCVAACYLRSITMIPITAPPALAPPLLQLTWLLRLSLLGVQQRLSTRIAVVSTCVAVWTCISIILTSHWQNSKSHVDVSSRGQNIETHYTTRNHIASAWTRHCHLI